MQLVSALPMPAPSATSLASYVTAVRWAPHHLHRRIISGDLPSNSHLLIAVGDRQGRVALWDFQLKSVFSWFDDPVQDRPGLGVQDICWIQHGPDSWLLCSIRGSSLITLWNTSTGKCVWKYDAAPNVLSCIRRDPYDLKHFCVLGLRGFLLSVRVVEEREDDDNVVVVVADVKEHLVAAGLGGFDELQKLDRHSSALVVFPQFVARFCFVPLWRDIVVVVFSRELVVFDLQYKSKLSSARLPHGCGKFMDVVPDLESDSIYCAHVDGKLSVWRRKKGEQVYIMCRMEELIPSIGTSIPFPTVLALILCQSEATIQSVDKLYINTNHASSHAVDHEIPLESCGESSLACNTYLISISSDGKIWSWLLTAKVNKCDQIEVMNRGMVADVSELTVQQARTKERVMSNHRLVSDVAMESKLVNNICSAPLNSVSIDANLLFEIRLVGQLHLLSSTVTVLAVPCPSLVPCLAPPLVALGSQSGIVDVIDISANAIASSFSVHSSTIRGLRWLGNSRLVSFSYIQVNEEPRGYNNRLVVSDLRSGLNRTFRILQKPEHAPVRALRASSSGRYLFVLIHDAPLEVWSMEKRPIMLRSLALPFTALEWTLGLDPWAVDNGRFREPLSSSKEHMLAVPTALASPSKSSSLESASVSSKGSSDELSESFAFALANGALGVFEVQGKKILDFRPKRPFSSFGSSEGLVNAMAYRFPHVVMGDRTGNISWWNIRTGFSSAFNTHREGIRRIKFSPIVTEGVSWGCIAVLFNDNTFGVFDLDSEDPLANSFLQLHFPGTLVLELDWLPLQTEKNEPQVLCIAGADSSFRLIEVNIENSLGSKQKAVKEKFRPMPLCSPVLLPTPHALALRMILQLGVQPSWFNKGNANKHRCAQKNPVTIASTQELRNYMIDSLLPPIGDPVVPELLLDVLEPYRREGCLFDDERAEKYATIARRTSAMRFAFTAAIFGEPSEALFWIQLPSALSHMMNESNDISPQNSSTLALRELGNSSASSMIISKGKPVPGKGKKDLSYSHCKLMAFEVDKLREIANERLPWQERPEGDEAIQKRVNELVSIGNLEAAVSLLLSSHPESSYFYSNALCAVVLSSALSKSLFEFSVKIVAANMGRTDKSLCATHLLCAVGRYQEACSQLQDAGCWTDAATLAATYLQGPDYARVLRRWADHVLHNEHNIWRALILYVAAGELVEVLRALQDAQRPETAIMFLHVLHEINGKNTCKSGMSYEPVRSSVVNKFIFPCLSPEHTDIISIGKYYEQYQRRLLNLCMKTQPLFI